MAIVCNRAGAVAHKTGYGFHGRMPCIIHLAIYSNLAVQIEIILSHARLFPGNDAGNFPTLL
jgi:hypothetical protein